MTDVVMPENVKSILFAGDWHGNVQAAKNAFIYAQQNNMDTILQLGDFGFWQGKSGDYFLDWISSATKRFGMNVYWIDGNHENFDLLETLPIDPNTNLREVREGVYHLPRGSYWQWEGLRFCALGGATSVDRFARSPGRSWWPQEAITLQQANQVLEGGQVDVLLLHDCPEGTSIPGIDRLSSLQYWPEQELRTAWDHREMLADLVDVIAPTHIFHGHFHVAYASDTKLSPNLFTRVVGLGSDMDGPNLAPVLVEDLVKDSAIRRELGADYLKIKNRHVTSPAPKPEVRTGPVWGRQ